MITVVMSMLFSLPAGSVVCGGEGGGECLDDVYMPVNGWVMAGGGGSEGRMGRVCVG